MYKKKLFWIADKSSQYVAARVRPVYVTLLRSPVLWGRAERLKGPEMGAPRHGMSAVWGVGDAWRRRAGIECVDDRKGRPPVPLKTAAPARQGWLWRIDDPVVGWVRGRRRSCKSRKGQPSRQGQRSYVAPRAQDAPD